MTAPGNFGQGGLPNVLPGRGYPEAGSATYRDADDFSGGRRGPAALPSRLDPITPAGDRPAPADPRMFTSGWRGAISYHRGVMVEDAGAPRLCFDNVFGHGSVPWSRPVYENAAGKSMYHAPTHQPNWSSNHTDAATLPASPIPVQRKQIGNFTVRRPFGDTSTGELFHTGSLADFVGDIGTGMNLQGRRWLRQSKTANPHLLNRSNYATAGSYGQTTDTLASQPANQPLSPYGAY